MSKKDRPLTAAQQKKKERKKHRDDLRGRPKKR